MNDRDVPASGRMEWVDVAKGLTIVLIVFAHTLGKHYMRLDWDLDVPIRGAWLEFNRLFGPMRMPLFLMLSGLLASRSLERGGGRVLIRRVANPYLLYVLWLIFTAVVFAVFDPAGLIDGLELTTAGLVRNLALPQTTLWYMLALAVFYLAAWVLRPLGAIPPLIGATAVSAAVFIDWLVLPEWTGMWELMLRYFPFFLVGAILPSFPGRIAGLRSLPLFVVAFATYLGVAVALRLGADRIPLFGPVAGGFGAAMGIMLAVRISTLSRPATGLAWIGRRTLPIFVLHVPFLAVVHWIAVGPGEGLWATFLDSAVAAALYLPVGTLIIVGVCLIAHGGVHGVGMGWLFSLPFGKRQRLPPDALTDRSNADASPPRTTGPNR